MPFSRSKVSSLLNSKTKSVSSADIFDYFIAASRPVNMLVDNSSFVSVFPSFYNLVWGLYCFEEVSRVFGCKSSDLLTSVGKPVNGDALPTILIDFG